MQHWQKIHLTSLSKEAHLAETLVVKLAQLWAYISLVVPVMSSHWAGAVPPETQQPSLCHSCPNKQGNRCLYSQFYITFYVIFTSKKYVEKAPNNAMLPNLANLLFFLKSSLILPMTLQSRRKLVVSPSPASRGLSLQDGGNGMRSPIGRWNLRLRGSMVITGLKVAWLPSCRVSSSSGIGWAWGRSGKGYRGTTR